MTTENEWDELAAKLEDYEDLDREEVERLISALRSGGLNEAMSLRLLELWRAKEPSDSELEALLDTLPASQADSGYFDVEIEHSGGSRLDTSRIQGEDIDEIEGDRPLGIWPLVTALLSEAGLRVKYTTPETDSRLVAELDKDETVTVNRLDARPLGGMTELFSLREALLVRLFALLSRPDSQTPRLVGVCDPQWPQMVVSAEMGTGRKTYAIAGGEGFDRASSVTKSKLTLMHEGLAFTLDLEPGKYRSLDQRLGEQMEAASDRALQRLICGDSSSALARPVALNAALAMELCGEVNHLLAGVERALELIEAGALGRWFN